MIMRILAVVVLVALCAFFGMSYYGGLFDTVSVSVTETGPYNFVYREHKGPYQGVKYALYDVFRFLKEKRYMKPVLGFAVFYDNPRSVQKEDLKSIGGYITDTLLTNVPAPYKTEIYPKTKCIIGTFPLRSFLSPMTGPEKFYPAMSALCTREKLTVFGPTMEIYDIQLKQIMYVVPVK